MYNNKPFSTCFDCHPKRKSNEVDAVFSSLGAIRDTDNQGGSRNDAVPPPSVIAINESNEALVAGLKKYDIR